MKKLIIITLILAGIGCYFLSTKKVIYNLNDKQNMNKDYSNTAQDIQSMTDLAKSIYQAYQQKDISKILSLAKTKIAGDASSGKESLDSVEKYFTRITTLDLNDQTEHLLPVDFSSITFTPQGDGIFKVSAIYKERKSTTNLIVYLSNDLSLDATSEQEVYLAKVGSVWAWVK